MSVGCELWPEQTVFCGLFSRYLETTSPRCDVITTTRLVTYANTLPAWISLCLASHRFSNLSDFRAIDRIRGIDRYIDRTYDSDTRPSVTLGYGTIHTSSRPRVLVSILSRKPVLPSSIPISRLRGPGSISPYSKTALKSGPGKLDVGP